MAGYRDWKRLRAKARTASDFRELAEWCGAQAQNSARKAAVYEAELRDWCLGDQKLRRVSAHCRDLARYWRDLGVAMAKKAVDMEAAARK